MRDNSYCFKFKQFCLHVITLGILKSSNQGSRKLLKTKIFHIQDTGCPCLVTTLRDELSSLDCTVHCNPMFCFQIAETWSDTISYLWAVRVYFSQNTELKWVSEDFLIFGSSLYFTPHITTSPWMSSSIWSASGISVSVHIAIIW